MAEDTVSCGAYARRAKMASKEEKEVEKSLLMAHWQLQCTQERYRRSGTGAVQEFRVFSNVLVTRSSEDKFRVPQQEWQRTNVMQVSNDAFDG